MKVITYFNESRLFAIVDMGNGKVGWFYRSTGTNIKAGRRWPGEWFPILGTNDVVSESLTLTRLLVYGKPRVRSKGWINKNVSEDSNETFFRMEKLLVPICEKLKETYKDKYWDDFCWLDHESVYNFHKEGIDAYLKDIQDLYKKRS